MDYTYKKIAEGIGRFLSEQTYDGFAIHCKSKDEAELLLRGLHILGRRWSETQPIVDEEGKATLKYAKHGTKTSYRFFLLNNDIYQGQKTFYEKNGLNVIEFEDFFKTYVKSSEETEHAEAVQPVNEVKENQTPAVNDETKSVQILTEEKEEKSKTLLGVLNENEDENITEPKNVAEDNKNTANQIANAKYDETLPVREKTANKPKICNILQLKVNDIFTIECSNIMLFYPNVIYRFNEQGHREMLVDSKNNVWIPCNEEPELIYLIEHPEVIKKIN